MISRNDILKGKSCPQEYEGNLDILVSRLNKIENLSGVNFQISSGFRDPGDQIRIYKQKGITDLKKIPMQSKHFFCQAADLVCADLDKLKDWIKNNLAVVEEIGLWFEEFAATPNWLHCQIVPPKSGRRFYMP